MGSSICSFDVGSTTGSFDVESTTGSFDVKSPTCSFDVGSTTGSFDVESPTGSIDVGSTTGSFDVESPTGSFEGSTIGTLVGSTGSLNVRPPFAKLCGLSSAITVLVELSDFISLLIPLVRTGFLWRGFGSLRAWDDSEAPMLVWVPSGEMQELSGNKKQMELKLI